MNNIGFLGGDLRIVNLAEIFLNDGYKVYCTGLEKANLQNRIYKVSVNELIDKTDLIIGSIPLSKDKEKVFTPFSDDFFYLNEILSKINNKKLIAGALNEEWIKKLEDNGNEVVDILDNEDLTILNAIPTAEGAIQIAMEHTDITLHGSKVLILGFGRIGKILAKMLAGIGAQVFCEARKVSDLAWIKSYNYNVVDLKDLDLSLRQL